jgi:thiol-disulfide isomerase/thioredoxin
MKKIFFIFAAFSLIFAGCSHRETTIINPEFESSNTNALLFSKLELADTATVVYADVYNVPDNWVSISSKSVLKGASGKLYKLLYSRGFELDKEVFMPASGTMSFILVFEPLDRNEKTVDYYEDMEHPELFHIAGIKLYTVKRSGAIKCTLKGEVVGRPQSSRIDLQKADNDRRVTPAISLPIRDGKFEYTLYTDVEESWELTFYDEIAAGAWYTTDFIAENGTLNFTLHDSENRDKDSIKGGKHTEAYLSIMKQMRKETKHIFDEVNAKQDSLWETGTYYTPEANKLYEEYEKSPQNDPQKTLLNNKFLDMISDGTAYTPEANALKEKSKNIHKTEIIDRCLEHIKNRNDIAGYTLLKDNIRIALQCKIDPAALFSVFHEIYEPKYPTHPYTALINSYIQADAVKVGKPAPDIVAEDADGKEVSLSELSKGKVTLIHLWATWCGPCRRHGKEMIPVYEQYKDKGFTVVGIVRENDRNTMLSAVKKDSYPWINLQEANDRHGIWVKFGIGNAGGSDFLVDANGNFLAIRTNPKEVEKILSEILQ